MCITGLSLFGRFSEVRDLWPYTTDSPCCCFDPANIAEGFKKRGRTDKARFMNISQGSLEETRCHLILAVDLGYLKPGALLAKVDEIGRILDAYSRSLLSPDS